jgi:Fe-Mn family superoxide dismutase
MEIHHTKHHQGYTDKMNAILETYPELQKETIETLLRTIDTCGITEHDKQGFINNAGGYLNHKLFWEIMGSTKTVDTTLVTEIEETFGSLDAFKTIFESNATGQFGSGWSWLVRNEDGALEAYGTANQDSPYLKGHTPIIGLDVWEHAYYLQYQNKRPDYVNSWWNVCTLLP